MRVIGAPPGLPRTEASCPGTLPRSPRRPSTLAPTVPRSHWACVWSGTCAHLPLALAVPARHPLSRPRRSTSPVPPRAHCSVHGASARRRRPPASQPASIDAAQRDSSARIYCRARRPRLPISSSVRHTISPRARPSSARLAASRYRRYLLASLPPLSALRSPPSAPMSASIMRTPVATPSVSPPSPSHACAS